MARKGFIDSRRLRGFTLRGAAPRTGIPITIRDLTTISTGHSRGLFIDYTQAGAKGGACYVRPLEVALSVEAACEGAAGIRIGMSTSGNPAMSGWYHALDIYSGDIGTGGENHAVINIGKESANPGTVDAFIRMRNHSGKAVAFLRLEGTEPADYLLDIQAAQTPVFGAGSGSKTSGGTCKTLKINIAGTPYHILAAEEWT